MGRFGDEFRLTLISNEASLAERADAAGVDCIGIDIERLNKAARQGHLPDARISNHEIADLRALRPVVRRAALFARLNPLYEGTACEVEAALAGGATVLMLPFFATAKEVAGFISLVDGQAEVVLLLETTAAMVRLHEILAISGIDEILVGLNDLRLSTGVASHFELVASDVMTMVSDSVRARGIRFGFGGVGRCGDDSLPIPSDLVLAQHARLQSTSAWISRSFLGPRPGSLDLDREVASLRDRLSFWASQPPEELLRQRDILRTRVQSLY
jgi:hypothetical protein